MENEMKPLNNEQLGELLQASLAMAYAKVVRLNKGEEINLCDLHSNILKASCEALELKRRKIK